MFRSTWYEDDPRPQRLGAGFSWRPGSVVQILILVNIALFVLTYLLDTAGYGGYVTAFFGLNPRYFTTWAAPLFLYQLVTYQFIHGGLFHILINMLILWFFGRELEGFLGRRRFLLLYLAGGVAGGVVQVVVGLLRGPAELPPVVGASGAVYCIMVYYALMWPNRTVSLFIFPLVVPMKVKYMAMLFVGISVLYGFFPGQGDMVAHMCHLGGAFFGFLFFRYEGRWRGYVSRLREHRQRDEERKRLDTEQEMDRLLKKIHDEGITALTERERRFLNQASRDYRRQR